MSEAERKSHIPDEKLAELTAEKLQELQIERDMISERLFDATISDEERERLAIQLENHDAATDKLTMYRADMLESAEDAD
ncbi:MAG: hypothetical protein ACO1Q7_00995 [Gemmatimonas sp.]